ncbi:restriction endonuclease subunit S [Rouxiella badensis]|uniref:restriction endonuclease subunit S n=1 Tax=Rouxiella badensis TaxID=1646377 RepID=UPI0028B09DD3|nr:restriction endonuclease subunit S [Rouxiella badensis]
MVPKGWEVKYLKDILSGPIRNGFSPVASDKETGFWILGLGALGDEGINVTEIKPVEPTDKVLQTKLSHGDFLVSRSNTPDKVGRSIYYKNEVENCSYPDLMMKFRVDENKVDPIFIEQKLKSSGVRAFFKNCAAGSSATMVKINKGILERTPLLLPSIEEQKKIAQLLSTWDKAIATTENMLKNSQKYKKALMQKLLTGKKRFAKFSDEWRYSHLCDMTKIVKGKSLSSKDLTDGEIPVIAGGKKSPYKHGYFTHENVITISASGAYAGYVSYHPYKIWASDCSVIVARDNSDTGYIYQLLTFRQNKIYSLQSGGAQPHIYPKDLESLSFFIPPLREQKYISSVLAVCDKEVVILEKQLHHLKQEKKALMQQLLTGKRRVNMEVA